jgi:hypothetical protein
MVILVIAVCYERYILLQNIGHLLRVRFSSINVAVSREVVQHAAQGLCSARAAKASKRIHKQAPFMIVRNPHSTLA